MRRFVNAIARGSANTDVRAGAGPASLELGDLASAGTPICYELLFPDLMAPTCVTASIPELRDFLEAQGGEMIVKPLDGCGGAGIFHLSGETGTSPRSSSSPPAVAASR